MTAHSAHFAVSDVRKHWHQLCHDSEASAWYTVQRFKAVEGLQGVVRGPRIRTARQAENPAAETSIHMQRQFMAARPNRIRMADFTYLPTSRVLVNVAFAIEVS